uniref:Indole-3-acetic acid-induced protein ARG7 n=1 Tax=Noccaea caerulescens TaxID=107243 RepID=A0A1J3DLY2_NOCCA
MDTPSPLRKKALVENPIMKTWRKMKSFGYTTSSTTASIKKSKSWNGSVLLHDAKNNDKKVEIKKDSPPPHGCFTVYVGPTKQRIVVKTKLVNHPLFKNLLEDAETEYGYRRDGPIVLPCEVDFFFKVLADMKSNVCHSDDYDDEDDGLVSPPICGLGSPYRSCCRVGTDAMAMRRNGSYKILRSPSLFKLNRF